MIETLLATVKAQIASDLRCDMLDTANRYSVLALLKGHTQQG